ncbi:MAG: carboxypeptidase regulatory-like domain-containing protein [Acidobacteriaceae bacterium]|nr:carboxypeptidase regulatory-like domain-containing protein [Acidobacteriaceae bacterium]
MFTVKNKVTARFTAFPLALLFVLFLTCGSAWAQRITGTLIGTVTDTTGAVIPNANVTVTNQDTGIARVVQSSAGGEYRVELLQIGNYTVHFEAQGFQKYEQKNLSVSVNQQATLDVSLKPGSNSEMVTVTDSPPQITLENATVSRTIGTTEIESLPVVDRSGYSLLTLVPGVQSNTFGNTLGFPQQVVQINGSTIQNNTGNVSYYLDGGLNMTSLRMTGNPLPNMEALAEVNVETSNYSASYGRMSSGVVNAVTKSGTNVFHGSVYEFHRETNFAANPWRSTTRSPLHRNIFGGVLGGPVIRNRTFFFFDYSGLRSVSPTNFSSGILPTAAQLGGDFSAYLPTGTITSCAQTVSAADKAAGKFILCNPTTRLPYANNRITDPLDQVAKNIVAALPAATNLADPLAPRYVGSQSYASHYNEYMGKIDHRLTDKQTIRGSWFYLKGLNNIQAGSGSIPWSTQAQDYTVHVINLSHTYTLSSNKVDQTWVSYTRSIGGRINNPSKDLSSFGSSFAIQGRPSLPNIGVTGYFTLTNAIDGPTAGTNFYSLRNLFIWNKGSHSLSIGGEASLNKDVQQTDLNNYGTFTFTSSTSARTGNAMADFLLGRANAQTQDAPVTAIDNSFYYALFLQDDWRATRRLTINAGLRWDVQTPPTDPQNKETTYISGGPQSVVNPVAPKGLLFPGDPGITRGIVPIAFQHFSPRLGLAWDPFGNGKTAIRAAGGLFWGGVSGNQWNATSNYYPYTLRYTFGVPGTLTNPYLNTPSPFPFSYTPGQISAAPAGTSLQGIATNFRWPFTYQLTASVQQQLSNTTAITIAYIGSLNRALSYGTDMNYPIFNTATPTANTTANVNTRRPIAGLGVINEMGGAVNNQPMRATSNYNGMQISFSQRMKAGISVNGYYTWSKTMASANLDNSTISVQDPNFMSLEKGPSSNDQRSVFVAAVIWKPNYVTGNKIARLVFNGWTVSPIIKLASGTPFTITTGLDNNQDGVTTDRPNLIGLPYDPTTLSGSHTGTIKYFNSAAFCSYSTTTPTACPGVGPSGSDGTVQRNGFWGPGSKNVDMAIIRDFPVYRTLKFQLRGDATNVFNFVNLSNPTATLNSPTVGVINSASAMRVIQVGGRLFF